MGSISIVSVGEKQPRLAPTAFVDPLARVAGQVTLGDGASVWAGAVVRGDDDRVDVAAGSAVLENCIVEAPPGHPVTVGPRAIISHGAIVHGATIGAGCLIGIGAIVLDGAVVGEASIIGAGAVVAPGTQVPPRSLVLGVPGKVVRQLSPTEAEHTAAEATKLQEKAAAYRRMFQP
jgi:carbonic anhydrase/acetyltransferase-like protein (isoleucine patch superfamily)